MVRESHSCTSTIDPHSCSSIGSSSSKNAKKAGTIMGLFNRGSKKRKGSGAAASPSGSSSSSSSASSSSSSSSSQQPSTPAPSTEPPLLSPNTEKRAAKEAERLAVLVQALRGKVEAEAGQAGAGGLANTRKRALYYEAEMLWQRCKDELPAGSAAAAAVLDDIDALEASFLKLSPQKLAQRLVPRLVQRLDRLLRVVTCALYLCLLGVVTFPPMVTVVPLVDALLKRLGWPKRFLLYEVAKKWSARLFLWLAGVFYREEGRLSEYETPALLLFQHGSNLDGFIILDSYPQFFKSIGKVCVRGRVCCVLCGVRACAGSGRVVRASQWPWTNPTHDITHSRP